MFKSAKEIADLQEKLDAATTQVTALTTERDDFKTKLATAEGQVTSLTQARDTAVTELATANGKITQMTTDHAAALQAQKDGEEARVTNEVTTRCAAAGVAPIARDPKAVNGPQTMTRAELNKLDHVARNAFFRNGGKLTD